jgi:hypothetical protein
MANKYELIGLGGLDWSDGVMFIEDDWTRGLSNRRIRQCVYGNHRSKVRKRASASSQLNKLCFNGMSLLLITCSLNFKG